MSADDDRLMAGPSELQLLGLAMGVSFAGLEDAAASKGGPEVRGDAVDDLEATVLSRGHGEGLGQVAEGETKLLELLGGGDPVVIDEEET